MLNKNGLIGKIMPVYTIIDTNTKKEWDEVMSWSSLEKLLSENPNLKQSLAVPKIVSAVGGTLKHTSDGWKDLTKRMHKKAGKESKIIK